MFHKNNLLPVLSYQLEPSSHVNTWFREAQWTQVQRGIISFASFAERRYSGFVELS